jgi:uncharacterized protein YbjT (DUF2867 family)
VITPPAGQAFIDWRPAPPEQLEDRLHPIDAAARARVARAAAAWHRFHMANPQVWELFERFSLALAATGRRGGARLVWERMRWELITTTRGAVEFKLNDHFPPFYARLFLERHPELAGFFETRTALADGAPLEAAS